MFVRLGVGRGGGGEGDERQGCVGRGRVNCTKVNVNGGSAVVFLLL